MGIHGRRHQGQSHLIDPGLYGALAGVAAITTALQAAVALQPLTSLTYTRERKRRSKPGDIAYNDARSDAQKAAWTALWLNIPAIVVNAAVLASWGRIAIAVPKPGEWEYWLPWVAVAAASAFLFMVALITGLKLRAVAKE